MFEYIKYTTEAQTALITINRPDVYNALNTKSKSEIIQAIEQANSDSHVRSIILTAEGKAFCSGQDLNDRAVDARKGPVDIGHTLETEWNPLIQSIRSSKKIVIAAINGVAAGAGLSIVLACDLKVALPKVRFISGFTQIGLCPDAGLSYQLVQTMGYTQALSYALLGQPMLSEEMHARGFLTTITDDHMHEARELAQKINQLAPLSVEHVKKNFQQAQEIRFSEVLEIEKKSQQFLGFSQDYREGVTAFLEKRAPQFKGN